MQFIHYAFLMSEIYQYNVESNNIFFEILLWSISISLTGITYHRFFFLSAHFYVATYYIELN